MNFEEGKQKKSRFDKGGNKVWPKYSKGGMELWICLGGIRFLIIWMHNKVLYGQILKPFLQDLLSKQHHAKQLSVWYKFPVCSRFFVNRASQAFLWYSEFFSESELLFSRNHCVIIPFQIEWPDRTSDRTETVAFAGFYPFETTYVFFSWKNVSSKF